MSVLGHVFDTLATMSLVQLLLAFLGCMGYALAQGGLLAPRGRHWAGASALAAAAAFTLLANDWTAGIMLVAFAVAGLGLFVAAAWVLSRSVVAAGRTAATDVAFAADHTFTDTEADQDLSRPADSGYASPRPPRPPRRRVQSA